MWERECGFHLPLNMLHWNSTIASIKYYYTPFIDETAPSHLLRDPIGFSVDPTISDVTLLAKYYVRNTEYNSATLLLVRSNYVRI